MLLEKKEKQPLTEEANIKNSFKGPAYAQLSVIIKKKIANGEYQPGSKIPSESALGQAYGLSLMTVRQAIGVLVEQNILRRVHGIGTFVCDLDLSQASFNMEGLVNILNDKDHITIRILKARVLEANAKAAASLSLIEGDLIIVLSRVVLNKGKPFLLNKSHLKFSPRSPIVESELEISSLSGIFTGQGNQILKKASLKLEPYILTSADAKKLHANELTPAFKISYICYDYSDIPIASGWFMVPMNYISFFSRIGLWDTDDD